MDELNASMSGRTISHYDMDDVNKEKHVHTITLENKMMEINIHSYIKFEKG